MAPAVLDIPTQSTSPVLVPDYLRKVYTWAYLTPWTARLLDHQIVVQAILWGNASRLAREVLNEIRPGDRVFQPAAVYGTFSRELADRIGPRGRLEIRDVASLQVARTRQKLADLPQVHVDWGDAAEPQPDSFDVVSCFFLLHEVPDDVKRRVVPTMLDLVRPGGKAIFVDYHRPHRLHPLKPVTKFIFDWLEPFAASMWSHEINDLAGPDAAGFRWRKRTLFGGLYQSVVAERD